MPALLTKIQFILLAVFIFCCITSAQADMSSQIGAGYGIDVRSKADIEQYEFFMRRSLPYATTFWNTEIASAVEFGFGLIKGTDSGDSVTGRFSITPEVILRPHKHFSLIFGVGAGFMVGGTAFSKHDLGGPVLFAAKLGVQYHLNAQWGLECNFYHQSNGDIYSHNYSLNMSQLVVTYTF
jgi:hypothetical protein